MLQNSNRDMWQKVNFTTTLDRPETRFSYHVTQIWSWTPETMLNTVDTYNRDRWRYLQRNSWSCGFWHDCIGNSEASMHISGHNYPWQHVTRTWLTVWFYIFSSDNWSPICSTSDLSTNRRNIHYRPALFWRFCDSGAGYKTYSVTYVLTCLESVHHGPQLARELETWGRIVTKFRLSSEDESWPLV